jgi:hypothetical protein
MHAACAKPRISGSGGVVGFEAYLKMDLLRPMAHEFIAGSVNGVVVGTCEKAIGQYHLAESFAFTIPTRNCPFPIIAALSAVGAYW